MLKDNIWVFDCEVFACDWLVVFKHYQTGEYKAIWNDRDELKEFIQDHIEDVFCGFNAKSYDQFIIRAILAGATTDGVKIVNDLIITGTHGWDIDLIREHPFSFKLIDVRDDMQQGLSLKAIEAHLHYSIKESSVPFDIERALYEAERKEVEAYCKHDVDMTECVLKQREDYFETKAYIGSLCGLESHKAMAMTNAKLAAEYLSAKPQEFSDERAYKFPENLDYDLIPKDAQEFFKRMWDRSIKDGELFSSKLETEIGACPATFAFGGLHGALKCYREEATDDRLILNYDVTSLYPSLMIHYGYQSRAIQDKGRYEATYAQRKQAKASGDKALSNALKLVLNTTYGAMLNAYNPLNDPKNARSICITGQLAISQLACAYAQVAGVRLIQINTDGVMFSCPKAAYSEIVNINKEWEEQTHLGLEEDNISLIVQKDVNNYVMRKTDGAVKCKGADLVRGISPAGAFNVNNNAPIVAAALREYLLNQTPIEKTIQGGALKDYQLIAKASHKYSGCFTTEDGVQVALNKCNRVFATTDTSKGTIYKTHQETGQVSKVAGLPDHVEIYNDDISDPTWQMANLDLSWYIDQAKRKVEAYLSDKGEKDMAQTDVKDLNVYQKLALARRMFLDAKVQKTGKNMHLKFKYFELEDITPTQIRIFSELGLLEEFRIIKPQFINPETEIVVHGSSAPVACARIRNIDKPDEYVDFTMPVEDIPQIVNKDGLDVTNRVQGSGMIQTYYRRYLKMAVLDISEPDEHDASLSDAPKSTKEYKVEPKNEVKRSKPAANEEERKEVAAELTNADAPATTAQRNALKRNLKKLKDVSNGDLTVAKFITDLSNETEKFTTLSKKQCEEATVLCGELMRGFEAQAGESAGE